MKITLLIGELSERNTEGSRLIVGSDAYKVFEYLKHTAKKVDDETEMQYIITHKAGTPAADVRKNKLRVQQELKKQQPDHVVCLGKPALTAIEDLLPEGFPKTAAFPKLVGKVVTLKNGLPLTIGESLNLVFAGKGQQGGYLELRTLQETIFRVVLPHPPFPKTQANYIDTERGIRFVFEAAKHASIVAVDTETTGLNTMRDKVRTIQVSFSDHVGYVFPFEAVPTHVWQELFDELGKSTKLVLQNGKFDYKVLKTNGVTLPKFEDLTFAHVMIDEREGHGLNKVGRQILGAGKELIEVDHLINGEIDEEFIQYAAADTDITRMAFKTIQPAAVGRKAYSILTNANSHLCAGEHYGIKLDIDKIHQLQHHVGQKLAEYDDVFKEEEVNPLSPVQVQRYFGLAGVANKVALLKLDDPMAKRIIDYRGLIKLKSSYLDRLQASAEVDGRFHPDLRLAGTVTGRTSSGSGGAPADMLWLPINSQNIPRPAMGQKFELESEALRSQLRSLFIADEGRVMLGMDFAAAEMRMAANACLDQTMIADMNNQVDTHSLLAIRAYNLPITVDLTNPSTWVNAVKSEYAHLRQAAKSATFAILYGGGISAIAQQANCSKETAELLRDTIYKRYPMLKVWIDDVHKKVKTEGSISTRYGRRRVFPYSSGVFGQRQQQAMLREAQNYVIQSEASDYCLLALSHFMDNLPRGLSKIYCQNMVHDALYFSVREEEAEEVMALLIEAAQTADNLPATLYADAKYAQNWGML